MFFLLFINMLENIIKTSSNKDSIVLDCFSGGGGTLYAAEQCGSFECVVECYFNGVTHSGFERTVFS
jgi:hypothetical protein